MNLKVFFAFLLIAANSLSSAPKMEEYEKLAVKFCIDIKKKNGFNLNNYSEKEQYIARSSGMHLRADQVARDNSTDLKSSIIIYNLLHGLSSRFVSTDETFLEQKQNYGRAQELGTEIDEELARAATSTTAETSTVGLISAHGKNKSFFQTHSWIKPLIISASITAAIFYVFRKWKKCQKKRK